MRLRLNTDIYMALGVLSICLVSCAVKAKEALSSPEGISQPAGIKTKANTAYRPPAYSQSPVMNPTVDLPSDFSPNAGVTFSQIKTDSPYLAITFDDGPHPKNTPRLLDMLRNRNIKATFYTIGRSIDQYPDIARRIIAEGHEIGNHTYTHKSLTKMSDSEMRRELNRTRDAIGRATGVQPRTMRPPYGALRTRQRKLIHREFGYPTILWSVDPLDWRKPGIKVVQSRILSGARRGGILLVHDLHKSSVDAMPGTLDALLAKGFQFVTVSQLITLQENTP